MTEMKFKLDQHILMTHLSTKYQFKMSMHDGDNEQKLKITGIFLSPRAITLAEIIQPQQI